MATISIRPEIHDMLRNQPSWCGRCDMPGHVCICNPDGPIRESSSVLRFMQSPNDSGHGVNILQSAAIHMCCLEGFALLVALSIQAGTGKPLSVHMELARLSKRVRLDFITASGYDYENQAWVVHGKYEDCGHPDSMRCDCFGRRHAGENVRS